MKDGGSQCKIAYIHPLVQRFVGCLRANNLALLLRRVLHKWWQRIKAMHLYAMLKSHNWDSKNYGRYKKK